MRSKTDIVKDLANEILFVLEDVECPVAFSSLLLATAILAIKTTSSQEQLRKFALLHDRSLRSVIGGVEEASRQ
jgi:hypothetical protein